MKTAPVVQELDLTPHREPALAPASDASVTAMFERFATDPNVSVEKIERLMALLERGEARKAEAAFNAAMASAQKAMRPVAADAYNPQTKSKYASYEALDRALRPIYTEHGFGLSFDTGDGAPPDFVRVLCYVTHSGGHARTYKLDMPADGKGAKGGDVMTKTHATGSGLSYGQRYLLKMIFNVAVGEEDDDGNRASAKANGKPKADAPDGFDDWLTDLAAVADEGTARLLAAWNKSDGNYRRHLITTDKAKWETLKANAAKVRA